MLFLQPLFPLHQQSVPMVEWPLSLCLTMLPVLGLLP